MKKILFVGLIVLALMLVSAGVALAVTNGVPDGDNHPYVGLLVFDVAPGTPGWRCSGALIAPTVVLPAGHCTDGGVAARFCAYEDVTYNHFPFPLYTYGGPGSGAVEGEAFTNPYYDADNPYGGGNGLPAFSYRDVGIVVLDEPIVMDEYAELPEANCGYAKEQDPRRCGRLWGSGADHDLPGPAAAGALDRAALEDVCAYRAGFCDLSRLHPPLPGGHGHRLHPDPRSL